MKKKLDAALNDIAIRCFRDTADRDYICARMAFRAKLIQQFYWSSLQAVEKYIKAILLLNRIKTNDINHDLERALKHANKLPFKLKYNSICNDFIHEINTYGRLRYLDLPWHVKGPKLTILDMTVWEIRRYCRVIIASELQRICDDDSDFCSAKYSFPTGILEKILHKKNDPARSHLVWKNPYFSLRPKKRFRMKPHFEGINSPFSSLSSELFEEVTKYVYLPKDFKKAYRESMNEKNK